MDLSEIQKIIEKNGTQRSALIPILLDIQDGYHFLSREALAHVAQSMVIPLVDVYRAATFYKYFSLVPKGEHLILVCLGTACHVCKRSPQGFFLYFQNSNFFKWIEKPAVLKILTNFKRDGIKNFLYSRGKLH